MYGTTINIEKKVEVSLRVFFTYRLHIYIYIFYISIAKLFMCSFFDDVFV